MKKKIDIKYLDIPNVCFSLTDVDDEREKVYSKQRKKRGFDDSETWSLDYTIARFIVPRLERYIKLSSGKLKRSKSDLKKMKKLLKAFKIIIKNGDGYIVKEKDWYKVQEGLSYFPEVVPGLWW